MPKSADKPYMRKDLRFYLKKFLKLCITGNQALKVSYWKSFTLVEIVVVLAIISILGAGGLGSMYNSLRSQEMVQANSRLMQDIRQARSEAFTIRRTPQDPWVHGVGVDISDLSDGFYNLFLYVDGAGRSSYTVYPDPSDSGPIPTDTSTNYDLQERVRLPAREEALGITTYCGSNADDSIDMLVFQTNTGRVRAYTISGTGGNQYKETCAAPNDIRIETKNNLGQISIVISRGNTKLESGDIYQVFGG